MAFAAATFVALALVLSSLGAVATPALLPAARALASAPASPLPHVPPRPALPTPATRSNAPSHGPTLLPTARYTAPTAAGTVTVIGPNCLLSGASAPIVASGHNFTVTSGFTGAILDECNASGLFGDGNTLTAGVNASAAVEAYNVADLTIEGFLIDNATIGILAVGAQGLTIADNTVASSGYGLEVEYSSQVMVEANTISGDYGSLYEVDDALTVSDNALDHTEYGAYAVDVNGATFLHNDCNGSTSALSVYDSTLVTAWGDNLSHSVDGLYTQDVSGLVASWNNASASEYPIQIYFGGNVSGTENTGPNATVGMTIYFTENASFTAGSFPSASEYGLEVEDATGVSVATSDFDTAGFEGIFVGDATDVTLNGDTADGFFDGGVVVSQSTGVSITGTDARNGLGALAPAFSTSFDGGLQLVGSDGSGSAYGLEDQGSLNVSVRDCRFLGMTNGDAGISLQSDAGITVTGSVITNATGDALDAFDSAGLDVTGNTFTGAAQEAVYVAGSDGVTLTNNDATFAGFTGFDLEQLNGFTVGENDVGSGTTSLSVGMYLQSDASGTVSDNAMTNETTSLELLTSTSVLVTNNDLSSSLIGIVVANTVDCTLSGNEVAYDATSFNISSSEHLAIFHNNFVDDTGWSLPPSPLQANWSAGYPGGGNYWSNDTQPDRDHGPGQNLTGPDGIVDSPWVLNGTNRDPYPLTGPWTVRTITFTESGLPPGTFWSVVVNGSRVAGVGAALVYDQPNAVATLYSYGVGPVGGYRATSPSGTVAPGGGNGSVAVTFVPFEYNVSFQAAGLAATTNWSIVIGSTNASGAGAAPVTFDLPNGSYTYRVAPVTGYAIQPASGPIVVSGAAESITIAFDLVEFDVTFVPQGLPPGASWTVTLGGTQATTAGGSLSFAEPNGSYAFRIGAPSGYLAHPASGTQSVNGTTTIYVAFTASTPTPLSTPLGIALVVAVIALALVAVLAIALLLRARRRRPPVAPVAAADSPTSGANPPPDTPARWRQ